MRPDFSAASPGGAVSKIETVLRVRMLLRPQRSRQVSFSVLENAGNEVFPRKISDFVMRKGPHSLSYSRIDASEP